MILQEEAACSELELNWGPGKTEVVVLLRGRGAHRLGARHNDGPGDLWDSSRRRRNRDRLRRGGVLQRDCSSVRRLVRDQQQ